MTEPANSTAFFTELSALTKHSPLVTLTIAREGARLRVVVTPKHPGKMDEDEKVEPHEAALVTPLSIVGTAEELDNGFIHFLKDYTTKREELVSTVADYEEEISAAKLALKGKTTESKGKRGALPAPAPQAALPALAPAPAIPQTPANAALAAL